MFSYCASQRLYGAITSGKASTTALEGSTEAAQFHAAVPKSSERLSARVVADQDCVIAKFGEQTEGAEFSPAFLVGCDGDSKKQKPKGTYPN